MLLWTIGSVIALFLLVLILLQLPPVQDFARGKLVTFLEQKIQTPVQIEKIYIALPKKIVLRGVYVESREHDTLLAGDKLAVDISLLKLIDNTVEINSIDLEGITANVIRTKDSVFNFVYIIDAFASDEPKDPDATPMKISVDRIKLKDIRIRYSDAITRNDVRFRLRHFDTRFETFDLPAMDFDIPHIRLNGLNLMLNQGLVEEIAETSVKVADTVSKRPDFKLRLGEIALNDINIGYDNAGTHLNTGVRLQKLRLAFHKVDIPAQRIDISNFELKGVKGNLRLSKADVPPKIPETDTTAIKQKGWKLALRQVDIDDIAFAFDDDNAPRAPSGIDYNHLHINKFQLKASNLQYDENVIRGNIDNMSVVESRGLNLHRLSTTFFYGEKRAYLRNLFLETPQTEIREEINIAYPSLEALKNNPGQLAVDANLINSKIGFADILLFAPQLRRTNPFAAYPTAVLHLDTRIEGKLSDIRFTRLTILGIGNTYVDARGRITGLPDAKNARFDITLNRLSTTSGDIRSFLPANTIPATISLPPSWDLTGYFRGTMTQFDTDLHLTSTYGGATIDATLDRRIKNQERYDADVALRQFDLGRLLRNDSIGKVSLRADVAGTGLSPKTANATLKLLLERATFNGYTYRDLRADGKISSGIFEVNAGMSDPNLTFDLAANGRLGDRHPNAKLRLNVDIADLQRLNLHAGPMKLRGEVTADIPNADPDNLNGELSLHHIQILKDTDPILLDSIKLTAVSTPEKNLITLQSQFAKAKLEGKYKLTELPTAIQNSIAAYYDTNPNQKKIKTGPQHFTFDLSVIDDPMLLKLVPNLKSLDPLKISGRYNTENDTIVLTGVIPRLVYGTNTISGGNIEIETSGDKLLYTLNIDAIEAGSIKLPFTTLSGEAANNVVAYDLRIRDNAKKEQYAIAGTLQSTGNQTELQLNPDGLTLNYEPWQILENNVIRFGPDGIYADIELRHESNVITAKSVSDAPNAPLQISFADFAIETLLNIIQKDKPMATGVLNGDVELRNLTSKPVFVSDLTISDLHYLEHPVGNLAVKVNNRQADVYAADVRLSGFNNDVAITGNYLATSGRFDLDLDLSRLNMKTVQAFTSEAVKDGSGYLSGEFKIAGTAEKPDIDGQLTFHDVAMRITALNSYFKDINETITVNDRGLLFDKFTIEDEKSNELVLDGAVLTTDFRSFGFDLTVKADNFRAVNSKAKDNDMYYGDLFLDAGLVVKGNIESPQISGNLRVNEDTKFSVVLPQSDPSIADREGIVEFVDEDNTLLRETEILKNAMDQTGMKGMDVNVSIQIDKEAMLSLIIDKGNGDYLNLKGEAELTGGIDPSGKTTLTGKYEFTEGAYEMTFNLLRRRFDIKPGSFIIWNGEPTAANINITAIYNVEAAPIDLLDDQLGGVSQSVRNTYKQKIPFQTLLKMNGELLKPVITFDIVLPDKNYNVSTEIVNASRAKLEQLRQEPSELNKQVFALLLMNRFIGENPFASEAGSGGAEQLARQSVSKILSDQMNNIAGDLIKGVELNFDLESTEDYTSGRKENRTDLNVGVSKRLLNDRLKVSVGSSFGLEGQEQQNRQANNIAGDISADYQLTPDGRYLVRAYRKNEYQVAIQGQVVETGVSFVLTMDYNKFRELFHRTEEEKEMKRREKERRQREREQARKEKEEAKENPKSDADEDQ